MNTPHKHADIIHAWADGAKIQYLAQDGLTWIDTDRPGWCERDTYRIKLSVEIPEGFTAYTKDARFAADANNIKGYEFLMSNGSKCFFSLGCGMPINDWSIIAYRPVPKKVVRWQWIYKGPSEQPGMTDYFYATKEEAQNGIDRTKHWAIIGKAEWTRMEFAE